MDEGYLLGSAVIKRIFAAVKKLEGQVNNLPQERSRWQRGGGASLVWGSCVGTCEAGESGTATLYADATTVGTETEEFTRYDTESGLVIEDGDRILLGYVGGEWTFLWADKICPDPVP